MTLKIGDLVIRSHDSSSINKNSTIGIVVGEIDWHLDDDHCGRKQKRYEVVFPDDLQSRFWSEENLVMVKKV
jgi:hypothetical protein